jgi:hypothetical protein
MGEPRVPSQSPLGFSVMSSGLQMQDNGSSQAILPPIGADCFHFELGTAAGGATCLDRVRRVSARHGSSGFERLGVKLSALRQAGTEFRTGHNGRSGGTAAVR